MYSDEENTINSINKVLNTKHSCEIDVRLYQDELWLGHDERTEKITLGQLQSEQLLVHAKNPVTFAYLRRYSKIHSFYHNNDDIALTSQNKIIVHQKADYCDLCYLRPEDLILVDLDLTRNHLVTLNVYGKIVDIENSQKHDYINGHCDLYNKKKIFKLLILDVDGVLTNGKKIYDTKHEVQYKEFNDRDFTAIKRLKAAGIKVALLTGDKWNSEYLSDIRRLPTFRPQLFSPQHELDKSKSLKFICDYNSVTPEQCAFVGDDYYDITMLNSVGFPFCPADAAKCVKENATIIQKNGGEGVVEELFNMYEDQLIKKFPYDNL